MASATLEKSALKESAKELSFLLADTYLLYLKSQNFHWNVEDPRFHSLHEFFEEQYEELAEAVDTIAERIRGLGEKAPASFEAFLSLTRLEESPSTLSGNEMLEALLKDHVALADSLRGLVEYADKLGDPGTSDLAVNRLRVHEKSAWMIRSHLTKRGT